MSDQQQAAKVWDEIGDGFPSHVAETRIAAALAAARAEEAARWQAKIGALRNLADSYGRWPFRVDPLDVARKIDAVLDGER